MSLPCTTPRTAEPTRDQQERQGWLEPVALGKRDGFVNNVVPALIAADPEPPPNVDKVGEVHLFPGVIFGESMPRH